MPIANQYNPQLVLVAAGFDAALGDPLGGKITSEYSSLCRTTIEITF
jgi:acetoin utilization deacetylase AcuC-like enzyme